MTTLGLVVIDVLDDRPFGLLSSPEVHVVHALDFQRAIDRFHRCVVPAVAFATHRHRDAACLELLAVIIGRVLGEFNRSLQHVLPEVLRKQKKLKSGRSLRSKLRSPGRPTVLHRDERWPFWKAIAQGHTSEDAAAIAGLSPAVGNRWFRQRGVLSAVLLQHTHRALTNLR